MTAQVQYLWQGADSPGIEYTLPADFTATISAVTFTMVDRRGRVAIDGAAATVYAAGPPAVLRYAWGADDTARDEVHYGYFWLTLSDGSVEPVPNDWADRLEIRVGSITT